MVDQLNSWLVVDEEKPIKEIIRFSNEIAKPLNKAIRILHPGAKYGGIWRDNIIGLNYDEEIGDIMSSLREVVAYLIENLTAIGKGKKNVTVLLKAIIKLRLIKNKMENLAKRLEKESIR